MKNMTTIDSSILPDNPEIWCMDAEVITGKIIAIQDLKDAMDRHSKAACTIAWVMLAFSICGIISNALSLRIFTHESMRCAPVNILLTGLSCFDLCLSIFVIPVFITPALNLHYRWNFLEQTQPYITFIMYPLTLMTQSASVWVFLVITCERWAAVCRPLQARRYSRVSNAKKALIAVCTLAVMYNLVRFGEFRLVTYQQSNRDSEDNTAVETNCVFNLETVTRSSLALSDNERGMEDLVTVDHEGVTMKANYEETEGSGYGQDALSMENLLYTAPTGPPLLSDWSEGSGSVPDCPNPCSINLTFTSTTSPFTSSSSSSSLHSSSSTGPILEPRLRYNATYMFFYYFGLYLLTHFAVPFSILLTVNIHVVLTILETRAQRRLLTKHERREHRIALMMGVVVVAFLVCNTIPFAMNLLEAYDRSYFRRADTLYTAHLVNDMGNLLVVVNSASTWLIYFAFSEKYRKRCLACFCIKLRSTKKGSIQSHRTNFTIRYSLHAETVSEPGIDFCLSSLPHSRLASPKRFISNGQAEGEFFLPEVKLT